MVTPGADGGGDDDVHSTADDVRQLIAPAPQQRRCRAGGCPEIADGAGLQADRLGLRCGRLVWQINEQGAQTMGLGELGGEGEGQRAGGLIDVAHHL